MSVYPAGAEIWRHAAISQCGQFRYTLYRTWGSGPLLTFVMLNPSTADAEHDDPTIRRCVGFARREGYDGILVVNLYAFRATKPKELWTAAASGVDITGGWRNDLMLKMCGQASRLQPLVAAWGAHARSDRIAEVLAFPGWESVQALGMTQGGAPRHPLYLPADAPLAPLAIEGVR